MKVSERIALIDKIGREMQRKYSYTDIDILLGAYKIKKPTNFTTNSKWIYSKEALATAPAETVAQIARELGITVSTQHAAVAFGPRNWEGKKEFRLFISHISKDKTKATRLKECLSPFGISGFVAHEDIHPTLEWQSEIEHALRTMDAFLAIHTPGFSQSIWTQQEIGFAVGRNVKVISFKMGEDPTGFISRRQALPWRERRAEQVALEIDALLSEDVLTANKLSEAKRALGLLQHVDDEVPF